MSSEPSPLGSGFESSGLHLDGLWFAYFSLGGNATIGDLNAFLNGSAQPSDHDHNLVAHALNEHYQDHGLDHPVPYADA